VQSIGQGKFGGQYYAWIPEVEYEYTVAGVEYRGRTLAFNRRYSKADALVVPHSFPTGRQVAVYFDPTHPGRSVLVPGGRYRPIELASDILLLLLGLGLLLLATRGS